MADEPIYVTGCGARYPVVDRHGVRIKVGDRLRAQVCVGRYGQTRLIETVVEQAHWPLGQYCTQDGGKGKETYVIPVRLDGKVRVLHCATVHRDYEHGHETWAEVVKGG